MIARVLRVRVDAIRVDAVIAAYRSKVRPIHQRAAGLHSHYVFTDRERRRIEIVGVWESPHAVNAVAGESEPACQALWESFGEAPDLDLYEVVDSIERRN